MNDQALQTREQLAGIYLQRLQALAMEIGTAMDAIAANEIRSFQDSVARQEMLCATLASMANTVGLGVRSSDPFFPSIDVALGPEIRTATRAIRELNLQYAALLKHSGRSIALLASLCRTHTGQFQEDRGPRLKRQTWSCEM
jgi:hypothetical protein